MNACSTPSAKPATIQTHQTFHILSASFQHLEGIAKGLQRVGGHQNGLFALPHGHGLQRLDLFQRDLILRRFKPALLDRLGNDAGGIGFGIGQNAAVTSPKPSALLNTPRLMVTKWVAG